MQADHLLEFQARAAEFISDAHKRDLTCPAFGAILPPRLFERAKRWQRHCFDGGFAGIHWPKHYGGQGLDGDHYRVWAVECAKRDVAPYMNRPEGLVINRPTIGLGHLVGPNRP